MSFQLNTEGACHSAENASALLTCSCRVCSETRLCARCEERVAISKREKIIFLLVGYTKLWSLWFSSRICRVPPVQWEITLTASAFSWVPISYSLGSVTACHGGFILQLSGVVTVVCAHKYAKIHLCARLRRQGMALPLPFPPWITSCHTVLCVSCCIFGVGIFLRSYH